MAFNYFPATYPQLGNPYQQLSQMNPQLNPQQQIQNGGFVSVRSEEEARNYPVAPGNSVTFRNETAPYVYTKTMGFSQLDRPIFDKYRLVKEDPTAEAPQQETGKNVEYVLKAEFDAVLARISALEEIIGKVTQKRKKEEKTDE